MSQKTIRDYIYLDTNRARSIYSQLKGGLLESFIKGNETKEGSADTINSRKQTVEQRVLLGTKHEATHVLHDYLFSQIETDLGESITDIQDPETVNDIKLGDYVRVSGSAEIDDTERLLKFAQSLNSLHSYISMAGNLEEMQKEIWDIQNKIDFEILQKREIDKLQKKLQSLKPPSLFRKEHKGIPDLISEMMTLWLELLYQGMFEIKIVPAFDKPIVFRSIIDRDYLREAPSLIYAKHSTRTQANWTLMGQVTAMYPPEYLGSDEESLDEEPNDGEDEDQTEVPDTNMRDNIENTFAAIKPLEAHLLVSAVRTTVVMTPLAIYQESKVTPKQTASSLQ